eukprot:gene9950-17449_t
MWRTGVDRVRNPHQHPRRNGWSGAHIRVHRGGVEGGRQRRGVIACDAALLLLPRRVERVSLVLRRRRAFGCHSGA